MDPWMEGQLEVGLKMRAMKGDLVLVVSNEVEFVQYQKSNPNPSINLGDKSKHLVYTLKVFGHCHEYINERVQNKLVW